MGWWSGKYSDTKESQESLEGDILRAMDGKFTSETSSGGTLRETYELDGSGKIDVYDSSDSPKGHSHDWLKMDSDGSIETGHHD